MWGISPYNGILLELRLLSPYKGALPPPLKPPLLSKWPKMETKVTIFGEKIDGYRFK